MSVRQEFIDTARRLGVSTSEGRNALNRAFFDLQQQRDGAVQMDRIEFERTGDRTARASYDGDTTTVTGIDFSTDAPAGTSPSVDDLERQDAIETLEETEIRVAGEELTREDLATFTEAGLESDRTFTSRQGDRVSLTLYDADRTSPVEGVPTLEFQGGGGAGPVKDFLNAVQTLGPSDVDPSAIGRDEELIDRAEDRETRRETREAARDAAEEAGVDLDEFGIGATAEGDVIVQDRDTGRTRNIDPSDAPGGVGSAIDAATGEGQFVADDADPAASGSGSGDGLGARAAGAVVLLFGALAAALGWLS